jgi:hypothetical protein
MRREDRHGPPMLVEYGCGDGGDLLGRTVLLLQTDRGELRE